MQPSHCNLCGKLATLRCNGCSMVVYCSREHQKSDWKGHKYACKEFQALKKQGQEWEGDVRSGEYAGTFRWSQKTDFLAMPSYTSPATLGGGWTDFFETRMGHVEGSKVVLDVPMIDGVSFPLSFLYIIRMVLETNLDIKDWLYGGVRKLDIVAIGCAERAEEHILLFTNYWEEIANMMPSFKLRLWLVGPEMSAAHHATPDMPQGPRMSVNCFRGTLASFMAETKLLEPKSSSSTGKIVVIGYNTGMASGDAALQLSWKQDIAWLLEHRVLTCFTCANDHSDLRCERALMAELKAHYVLYPRKNPFQAVTILHPPGQQETGWYSANAFLYAVQGTDGSSTDKAFKGADSGPNSTRHPGSLDAALAGMSPSAGMPNEGPSSTSTSCIAVSQPCSANYVDYSAEAVPRNHPQEGSVINASLVYMPLPTATAAASQDRLANVMSAAPHGVVEALSEAALQGHGELPTPSFSMEPVSVLECASSLDLYLPD